MCHPSTHTKPETKMPRLSFFLTLEIAACNFTVFHRYNLLLSCFVHWLFETLYFLSCLYYVSINLLIRCQYVCATCTNSSLNCELIWTAWPQLVASPVCHMCQHACVGWTDMEGLAMGEHLTLLIISLQVQCRHSLAVNFQLLMIL